MLSRLGVEVGEKRIGTTMRSTLRALLSRRVSYPGVISWMSNKTRKLRMRSQSRVLTPAVLDLP